MVRYPKSARKDSTRRIDLKKRGDEALKRVRPRELTGLAAGKCLDWTGLSARCCGSAAFQYIAGHIGLPDDARAEGVFPG
jgi:hypothetical protein